jgi:hypothetical protein
MPLLPESVDFSTDDGGAIIIHPHNIEKKSQDHIAL